ncbi:uncharacterized protein [Battus philenor]
MERQDQQVKKVVSLCMNTINGVKNDLMSGEGSSGRQSTSFVTPRRSRRFSSTVNSDDTTNSDKETDDYMDNKSNSKQNHQYRKIMKSRRYNICGSSGSSFSHDSPPRQFNNKIVKRSCDKSVQVDLDDTSAFIDEMERILKNLYKQFLVLISQLSIDDPVLSEMLQCLPNFSSDEISLLNNEWLNRNTSTPSSEIQENSDANGVRVRRASAHTTNIIEAAASETDMVSIGSGNVSVPNKLLEDIDWTSYTGATRHLLQAIFPRRVLATHSLSGKQSPAFSHKPPKKRLDPKVVDDIVNTVAQRCGVHKRLVRSCITTKCTDEAKLFKNRQHYKLRRQMEQDNLLFSESSNTS